MALTDSLVAYWSLEEASGSRADATGRGNTLSETGTPGNTTGKVGNAADLTGSNYLSIATNSDVESGNVDFTWAFWVLLDSTSNADILGKWAGSGQLEYDLFLNGHKLNFLVSSNGSDFPGIQATSFGDLSTSTWYFVVAWHDSVGNTLNICINDGTVDSTGHSAGVFVSTTPLSLAFSNFGAHLDGKLDEVGLWKRVLTSGEITQLYNGGAGLAYASFGGIVVPVFLHQYQMLRAS